MTEEPSSQTRRTETAGTHPSSSAKHSDATNKASGQGSVALPSSTPLVQRLWQRLARITGLVRSSVSVPLPGRGREQTLRQSIEDAIEGQSALPAQEDDLGIQEREMLRNLLHYAEVRVDDIMVPRADIVAFDVDADFAELIRVFCEAAHSRLPIFRNDLDEVVGMVHIKDVVMHISGSAMTPPSGVTSDAGISAVGDAAVPFIGDAGPPKPPPLSELVRSVLFVPPSMRVIDLLARMRRDRTHMAIVVDEYGGTDGLVTIEDVVEEIVGEIEDEHDIAAEAMIREIDEDVWDADARMPVEDLEDSLALDLTTEDRDDDVDTLGGLVFTLAGKVPAVGEVIEHPAGFDFEVLDGDPRRITKLRITRRPEDEDAESNQDQEGEPGDEMASVVEIASARKQPGRQDSDKAAS